MALSQHDLHQIRAFNRDYTELLGLLNKRVFKTTLSWPEARVLMLIAAQMPISPKDVAARLALDRSYTSRLIKKLATTGLVKKTPSVADSRAVILTVTTAGMALNTQLDQQSDKQVQRILQLLTPSQQQCATQAIETLQELLFKS